MFEKVNPSHPDKVADRIAGAIVDLAYEQVDNPKIAVEVLIGHGFCTIITETNVALTNIGITDIVYRIIGNKNIVIKWVNNQQDVHLANNQEGAIRCGDNGIFRGVPVKDDETELCLIAQKIYKEYPSDGKYVIDKDKLIICQSNAKTEDLKKWLKEYLKRRNMFNLIRNMTYKDVIINPLGEWTGGTDVDCGATNRKLGSDLGGSVTGGGLHGKDLSKADVSITIYAWLKAQATGKEVEMSCAIGDEMVNGVPYSEIVEVARKFINEVGGFEKLAEWGLLK